MQCLHCGNQLLDGSQTCPNCGAPVSASNVQGQPNQFQQGQFYGQPNQFQQGQFYGQPNQAPYGQPYGSTPTMTKKEFWKHPSLKSCRGNINGVAILLYFSAAVTLLTAVLSGNYFILIDALFVLGMGLGIQLGKSRVCAILIFAYSIYNLIYGLITTGKPTGWLVIIAGILAIIYTFKFQKAWKEYQQTGVISA